MLRSGAVIVALLVGSICTSTASAATLVVDDDRRQCPAAPYRAIQPAVDAASPGDRVSVCAGTYRGQVWIRPAKAGLVVESTPRRAAVILAPAQFTGLPRAMVVAAGQGSVVRGFRILGPLPAHPGCDDHTFTHDAGVQIGSELVRVEDNEIDNIRDNCGRGDGINAGDAQQELGMDFGTARAVISANLIKNYMRNGIIVEAVGTPDNAVQILGNEIAGAQTRLTTGILAAQEGIIDAEDNLIHSNRGPGIALEGVFAAGDEIRRNRVRGNGTGIEIGANRDAGSLIEDNDISANRGHGIVDTGGMYAIGGTRILGNVVRDNVGHGLLLQAHGSSWSPSGIVERNQLLRNRLDGIHAGDSLGYQLSANTALDNHLFDCRDTTTGGTGTAGTNNTWTANRGRTSSPAGLCVP